MNILYYDCFAGISGDMHLGALLDTGLPPDVLKASLSRMGLDETFSLKITRDRRSGIRGTCVSVNCMDDGLFCRHLSDIRQIVGAARLPEPVEKTALAIFQRLAEAEAAVHGQSVNTVHFHEVGAMDALVDIVGAAVGIHYLKTKFDIAEIWSAPVELGGGWVDCAHGRLPVPAPATEMLLRDIPIRRGAVLHEATTPTGAAILAEVTDRFIAAPAMTVTRSGHGIGRRKVAIPNLLRLQMGRADGPAADAAGPSGGGWRHEKARLLETNVDDMSPEYLSEIMDLLLENGADDVDFTAILMKKNRPAVRISVLCSGEREGACADLLFRHTTTLGIRSREVEKYMLERHVEERSTAWGTVRVKHASLSGRRLRSKPELEDLRRISRNTGIPLPDIRDAVMGGDTGEMEDS
ncbi:MAG: TIGR00299 family protein [Desulfococcus sp.]|nr:MAG: TIGR00299 family protein [Desulfococcus sp.]